MSPGFILLIDHVREHHTTHIPHNETSILHYEGHKTVFNPKVLLCESYHVKIVKEKIRTLNLNVLERIVESCYKRSEEVRTCIELNN